MADLPVVATALGLQGCYGNVNGHPGPGRRFIVQGTPTGFFYRGKRPVGEASRLKEFVVAFRGRTREDSGGQNGRRHERRSWPLEQIRAKVRPIEKN